MNPSITTPVFIKKAPYMQRIADLVRSGHTVYTNGVVEKEKGLNLVKKFSTRYAINIDKMAASRDRKAGLSSCRLLILNLESDPDNLTWILLINKGSDFDIEDGEKWKSALSDRIQLTGYELVRLTRAGSKSPRWTWKYTKSMHDYLRNEIIMSIRNKRDDKVEQLIHELWRTPGFSGARDQVKKFGELIRAEWKRSRGTEKLPDIPDHLGYVRRIKDGTKELGVILGKKVKVNKVVKVEETVVEVEPDYSWLSIVNK